MRYNAYRVHAPDEWIVGRSVILCSDEHAASLSWGEIDHVCLCWLSVDAIYFDNLHGVALEPKILTSKGSDVDDAEHVSLTRLNERGQILSVVHQCSIGNRFSSCGIFDADESLHQIRHQVMIPIRKSQVSLLVILTLVWGVWVVNDEWSSKSIRILSRHMRVIPVCARLFDLL